MEKTTLYYNDKNIEVVSRILDSEIEQNDFIPDTGEDTVDLKEVLELARKMSCETYISGMEDIID
ncbi:MAG: hypothetical protein II309_04695 [Bacilli bacterium]|jgi:hypothetical protein|nr:hypothetical protein [Bacilli bacterium]